MRETLLIAGSYALGSVPFALLLGLSRGVDIRRTGSGNVGATNLGRALGRRWAVAAFTLDFAKGTIPVLLARFWAEPSAWLGIAAGCAAVLGHIFSVFLGFRGGKGVATAFGAMTALAPIASTAAGALWWIVYQATRAVSAASLVAGLAFPLGVWASHWGEPFAEYRILLGFAIVLSLLITWRHRSNIARLLRGEEHRFDGNETDGAPQETTPKGTPARAAADSVQPAEDSGAPAEDSGAPAEDSGAPADARATNEEAGHAT